MSARLLLIAADAAVSRTVRSALETSASLMVLERLPEAGFGDKYRPDAILIDSEVRSGVQTAFEKIESAKQRFAQVPVIVLGNELSAQLVLAALRAGADEFVDREADAEALRLAVARCLDRATMSVSPSRARIAGVLSALGSAEDQDFALNLAVRAASALPGEMTLYIDLAVPATQAAIALGLKPEFGVLDAVREVARVDKALLESALARDPRSGLYVLPLCADFGAEVPSFEAASFAALLEILRSYCATIVIHYGPFSRQRALLEMVRPAARLFVCCNQRFPSIRGASDLLGWLSQNALGTPEVVVHGLAPGRTPSAADIRKALKIAGSIDLDASWDELAQSVNDAKPMALVDTAYCRGLDACLARLGLAPEQEPGFLAQLLGWLAPKAVVGAP